MSTTTIHPRKRVMIMGAAGRDFHNFNVFFRDSPSYEVVAFTATQIPGIDDRSYPAALAGQLYPQGIPIIAEAELDAAIPEMSVDEVVFAYSDVRHEQVMHIASRVLAAGADFRLLGSKATMLHSTKPVIAVCATRTGCGKSQTTRAIASTLRAQGKSIAVVRHPMPYGDLEAQRVQRFATLDDLVTQRCTIEEREEYEPHISAGSVVYAGVDYEEILRQAESEADVILWDGGNNDLPFFAPDLFVTVLDPLRPGDEIRYHPGEANLRAADLLLINKVNSATPEQVDAVKATIAKVNPRAEVILGNSTVTLESDADINGKRVVVVEDGPTLTHGEMGYGAGVVAARRFGATLVDPRPWAVGSIKEVFEKFHHIGALVPAMGYSEGQVDELEETLNETEADLILIGTPIDLRRVCQLAKPAVRVRYELELVGEPTLESVVSKYL
jgi:predicted GTPase